MKLNKWLNFAGVLNIVVAILMIIVSNRTIIPAVFLIVSGFYYRNFFNKEGPLKRKTTLNVLGICNLFFNLISGIIVLEVSSLMKNNNYEVKENKSSRINILLQLGVILVLLSGIMIATNQTLIIPNLFKILGLIVLSIIFFFLSYVSKKYLKLESSFKTYFLLGISFIIISFIGLYYYKFLGSLSFEGPNYLFFYPLLFLLISICSLISGKVISSKTINYITSISLFISLSSWFNAIELSIINNLLLITLSVTLINFIYEPSCQVTLVAKKTAHILSYILIPINLIALTFNTIDTFACILSVITTINIFHVFIHTNNKLSASVVIPTLILNSLLIVLKSAESEEIGIVFFQIMMIVFYFIIKLIKLEDLNIIFKNIYKYLFNCVFIITSVVSLFISSEAALIISSLLLFQNIIEIIENKKTEKYLESIKTLLFIISLVLFINSKIELDLIFNIFIIETLELILYLIIKNKLLKNVHYGIYLTLVGLIAILSINTDNIYLALIALASSIIPLTISVIKKSDKLIGITIFTSVALIFSNSSGVFEEIYYLNYLITFILMSGYAYIFKADKYRKYISLYSIAILLLMFIETIFLSYDIYYSLKLLMYSYVGLLISTQISNSNKNSADIFASIYFALLILINLFQSNIYLFITINLITIIMIIIGSIKNFKKIKFTAIILFIINLIYELKDFWKDIPVAIYLLIIGLILIGIVVVKEIKENKK